MVVIRLARRGAKHNPKWRFTVADSRFSPKGRFIEVIGHYDPLSKDKRPVINEDKYKSWIAKGAQPSRTVASLYKRLVSGEGMPKKSGKKALASQKAAARSPQNKTQENKTAAESKPSQPNKTAAPGKEGERQKKPAPPAAAAKAQKKPKEAAKGNLNKPSSKQGPSQGAASAAAKAAEKKKKEG